MAKKGSVSTSIKMDWLSEDELAAVSLPPSTLSEEPVQAFSYGIRRRANRKTMWLTLTPGILEKVRLVMLRVAWTSLDCHVGWMSMKYGRNDHQSCFVAKLPNTTFFDDD